MNTMTAAAAPILSKQYLLEKEQAVFSKIPGIDKLRSIIPGSDPDLERKYPDAAFALMILRDMHSGDWEQNQIYQKAYKAILNGESLTGVQFRFDYDQESYLLKHMWD